METIRPHEWVDIDVRPITPTTGMIETKCTKCNGDGYTAEHDPCDPHEDGVCSNCPIQVQCEHCEGTGVVKTTEIMTASEYLYKFSAKYKDISWTDFATDYAAYVAEITAKDVVKWIVTKGYVNGDSEPHNHIEASDDFVINDLLKKWKT